MTPHRTKFRPRQRVQLSEEGLAKQVAVPRMKGVVLSQSGPLVRVKEDGAGAICDYHEDFIESIPVTRSLQNVQ